MEDKKEDKEYLTLLKGLLSVAESAKGQLYRNETIVDIEGLFMKFVLHCSCALYLSKGIDIPPDLKNIPDPGSFSAVSRAALECFITFHYLFVAPKNNGEAEFRYLVWKINGLQDRQRYDLSAPEKRHTLREKSRKTLEFEAEQITKLTARLHKNEEYNKLTNKPNIALDKFKGWRLSDDKDEKRSWVDLGVAAGLDRANLHTFYRYLSGYAHTSSLSVLQMTDAFQDDCPSILMKWSLSMLKCIMASMIVSYIKIFPTAQMVLGNDSDLNNSVNDWHYLGTHSDDEMKKEFGL